MRKVRVDFFRATFQKRPKTFEGFLQNLNQLTKAKRLRTLGTEAALYMPNVRHRSTDLWTGELQYIRRTNLPDKIDLSTLVDDALGLLPSQGLLEKCHFAYRADLQALALQSSRYVRPSTFESYVEHVEDSPFELTLIIKRDAYLRMLKMRTIASLSVKIENPPSAAEFTRLNDPGVSAMAELLTNFGAAKIEVTLKRERRGFATLAVENIKQLADRVLSRPAVAESFRSMLLKGKREDDEKLEPVDLIKDRLLFEGEVGYDSKRRLDATACENLLVEALEHHARALRREQQ
jgi:hypothetical protein